MDHLVQYGGGLRLARPNRVHQISSGRDYWSALEQSRLPTGEDPTA